VKLPAYRAGLHGNEISFFIVPLDPTYKAGLAGHLPANPAIVGVGLRIPVLLYGLISSSWSPVK
jgi:hypothetical protein